MVTPGRIAPQAPAEIMKRCATLSIKVRYAFGAKAPAGSIAFVAFAALGTCSCAAKDDGEPAQAAGSSGASAGAAGFASSGGGAGSSTTQGGASGSAGARMNRGGSGNASQGGGAGSTSNGGATGGGVTSSGGDGNRGGTAEMSGMGNAGGTSGAAGRADGGSGSGGSSTGGDAGEPGTGGCTLNDDFEDATLDPCWLTLNGSTTTPLIQIAQQGGALHLSANGNQNGVWYGGSTKSLVYQLTSAPRFTLTTVAHPRKVTAPDALPTKDLHVGGIMVRNPASSGGSTENYVFLMVGHSENNNGMVHQGVEYKTTVNGCSNWDEPDWGANFDEPDAELRICRLGAEFRLYKRVPGDATWTAATPPDGCDGNEVSGEVLTRSDLPETVQVGLAINFNAPSDLDVGFDSLQFVELPADATPDACTAN